MAFDNVQLVNFAYIIASIFFIFGLKKLGHPDTARLGNILSAVGMAIACIVTLLAAGIESYAFMIFALVAGSVIGVAAARLVAMTSMPEMVALFNGSGGISSLLLGWSALYSDTLSDFIWFAIVLSVVIGGITFSGSLVAYGKLSERLPSKAIVFSGQHWVNGFLALLLVGLVIYLCCFYQSIGIPFYLLLALVLLLGVMLVIPIGGADMPVVIALLNSYSGVAACMAGFAISNHILVVAGTLVGASGIILTNIMCKAMNRSLSHVLFSGFSAPKAGKAVTGEVKPIVVEDAYYILEAASSVVFVPGYGMAVAQAQHAVRELDVILSNHGVDVCYAIHPVAGRMPGHMNVLLAEASVPYDQLLEMEQVNPKIEQIDVAIVIGANDVVNPAARHDESSPIYGMPVIDVEKARTVFVLKRSMASGFSGVDNHLFFKDNVRMLFGDAKQTITDLVSQFKS